jgi:hypothetical protein
MAKTRIRVGTPRASIELSGVNDLLDRAVRDSTRALRKPLEASMRQIYNSVKQTWPRPTKANRGGNRRRRDEGFSPPGWASTGYSHKGFRWQTFVDPKRDSLSIAVALLNPAQKHPRKGRYLYMARYPYPSRKFYWRELIGKPMRKESRRLIPKLAEVQSRVLGG